VGGAAAISHTVRLQGEDSPKKPAHIDEHRERTKERQEAEI